jgi:two-component system, OmpR family, phosphate regulon sensor histidine kinase PhoR
MTLTDLALVILAGSVVVLLLVLRNRAQKLRALNVEFAMIRRDLGKSQEWLQLSRAFFENLAGTTFDGLLIVDRDRRVTVINPAGCEMFGVKDQIQAVGQTLMTVTRNHELDALVEGVLRGETGLETQIEINERAFRVRAHQTKGTVQPNAVIALQDISELLRLTRARREMVANFSHDLRTPISSIRLLVDTLTHHFGRNGERDLRLLGKIAGETDSLQHMTVELIDLSMIESGRAIIRMVPVTMGEILGDAFSVMATQIEQKKLELVNEIPDDLRVSADPEQTRRVVTNVIHNSLKFTPPGGQIRFTVSCANQMATIRIQDTGPGIPPQDRTRIFERFYQVDTARTGGQGTNGSGLGLSIAKHIIEAQGGKIWAEAGIPNGACICFTISLADAEKSAA